ncbi:MAG: PrsW family glutamic-type intramembrane protease [Anaerolineae bacterium]
MTNEICCICDRPVEGIVKTLGGRCFCERHYRHVTQDRKGLWRSTLALIVGLVIFGLTMWMVGPVLGATLSGGSLIVAGVVLALIPAALWLVIFYLQDRLEPEPKPYILGIFLLGALLAQGAAIPMTRNLFRVQDWLGDGGMALNLLGQILTVGFIQEYLKYVGVRFTIFNSPEFDERVDGIIYGAAMGLGFATMLNIYYVTSYGGVQLGVGVLRITIEALAQASFAGISGYFLGRAKFEDRPFWWLPAGVTLAAVLNGLVTFLLDEVSMQGLKFTPIYSLILAAVIAGITFAALFTLMRRLNATALTTVKL